MSKFVHLKSVVWKEEEYYIAQCLEVDVSSFGKTRQEALSNLQDALQLYFEDTPLPKSTEVKYPVITSVKLSHA